MKLDTDLSASLTKTKTQTTEKNYVCQRFAARHGLLVTTTTTAKQSQLTHRVQETNINRTTIDFVEKSSNHCPLLGPSLRERLDKYITKNTKAVVISSETKQNLSKLQKITDDVKLLTKQLQLSVQLNQNNNCSSSPLDERLLGEICYQLERRILVLIFSKSKQFYGYSLRYLPSIIESERNEHYRSIYQHRFEQIETALSKIHFQFDYHPFLTFDLINQYGIYADYQWLQVHSNLLSNVKEIKSFCTSILSKKFHDDLDIIVDSLELISHLDGKPLFYW